MTDTELLMAARDRILDKTNWWGKDKPWDGGQSCAVQAIYDAQIESIEEDNAFFWPIFQRLRGFLDVAAKKLYAAGIEVANDTIGYEAVMECYDYAIKLTKENEK